MYYLEFVYFDGSREEFKNFSFGEKGKAIEFMTGIMRHRFIIMKDVAINVSYIAKICVKNDSEE